MAIQLRASSSLSSASSTGSWRHDVFLSFRGEDTRYGFTGHLHRYLVQRGINTFIDDDDLPRGEEISEALLRAIEGSKLSLIVFSENYAFSKWCLDELVHILGCRRSKNQMVRPIFYKVDPTDVRHQRDTFGEALAEHERIFKDDMDKVLRWRAALLEAANLSGWHFSSGHESKFIDIIVEEVSTKLKERTNLDVAKCPVGIDSRLQDMLEILDVGGGDRIRMVGIWGSGGIGKTTIAKAAYNTIAHKFDGSCFLANVREGSEQHGGLVNLQNIILSKILGGKELKVINVDEGITLLRERLRYKRVLLVLDDVDRLDQLEKLAGRPDWFHSGSRVIITTRDKHLLIAYPVNQIYKARKLDHHEACELFLENALMTNRNMDNDEKLAVNTIVEYAQGLPLALKVLGSHLCSKPICQWRALLDGHRRSPLQDIQKILKISYDALEEPEKEIFLHIACFFKHKNKNDVIAILEGCGYSNPMSSIEVLEEKALLNVEHADIFMHDLLEEMGKKIVHEESPKEPGGRTRLWYHKDVLQVLTENTGTSNIEGIMVKMPTADEIRLSPKCFKKMINLKLFINVNGRFCGNVDYFPNQLRVLDWRYCPLQSLPSNFNMKNMVQLSMPCSRISCFGEGFKSMENLKSLKLRGCKFLAPSPDLSGSPNLEFLDLSFCTSLKKIHPSVGSLKKLVILDLSGCKRLEEVYPSVGSLKKLVRLDLSGCKRLAPCPDLSESPNLNFLDLSFCTSLKKIHPSVGSLKKLVHLNLCGCKRLEEVHPSVGSLKKLIHLDLEECSKLRMLPGEVDWRSLQTIKLDGCRMLESFPEIVGEMKYMRSLSLYDTGIKALPSSIGYLINLEWLELQDCGNLTDLPYSIYELQNLEAVYLYDCPKLVRFPNKGDSEVLPTYSKVSHDEGCSSMEPHNLALRHFTARGCDAAVSNTDFLASLDWAREIDISGSAIVILSECINEFLYLRELNLSGCTRLVEIPELPPSIRRLYVSDCVSLERISKLSNILERKESQMIEEMDLTNCWRLCQNLVQMANKDDDDKVHAELFSRLLSSQLSKFTITFPVPRSEVPKWFSCQMDFKGHHRFEFCIETLANFKWDYTGLALCVAVGQNLKPTAIVVNIHIKTCNLLFFDHLSVSCLPRQWVYSAESDHVWLHYVPFLEMWPFDYMRPLPPFTCRVIIQLESYESSVRSCGVHLVMPPNEDVCMKLIRNHTRELPTL
ncbi:putative TIR domain, P-loop containing nucleoside triphosphate hydrolase [Rosa chinensis]|uniref:Putative TIR domain, P-loop containing nucleoside triphosphate hydrolase n=1 Tax=Rosa chinensis TaxID=74649 RepID=A0A2P6PPZ0_ROSCH|nr:disease resistance protein RPV1 [Rosa chinensis]XP_040365278.1 disease resistance protein RPV1 [Rosa chinensis]XP_040365279.1 disease resistance protein RPV1 [Rosa chinensis]XP_040365280.1 disease resistance protein RPV1 [Rosa chinensis]XP_040365281.1 disease resistance protein RPV1 [Rosa chinensis]XP_040365282.1 disease resistance protein RPV1 [Rosa chinensis]XP_040365283.1 disease resistance protein RPV1 [Rosa chinensis]PRQ24005.1 putative TIR domain, P-loop containing nucleoside tripho